MVSNRSFSRCAARHHSKRRAAEGASSLCPLPRPWLLLPSPATPPGARRQLLLLPCASHPQSQLQPSRQPGQLPRPPPGEQQASRWLCAALAAARSSSSSRLRCQQRSPPSSSLPGQLQQARRRRKLRQQPPCALPRQPPQGRCRRPAATGCACAPDVELLPPRSTGGIQLQRWPQRSSTVPGWLPVWRAARP